MAIRYREDKATQAAARLVESEGGKINHMKLIKLLYLADRAALLQWGRPITFDWYYSLPHGPVPSFTLDIINSPSDPENPSYWHLYISEREDNEVSLVQKAPNDQLSPAEEDLLDQLYSKFGDKDEWQLREYSHQLPEWNDPHGSCLPIEISDILSAEGFSEEDIREIVDALEAESFANSLAD